MQVKVSIIIPVYNNEGYLQECLDSVLAQTYDDMEILLIDDASEDASGEICDSYAKKYPCVQAIHIDHCGVGGARNEGLRIARGEYIAFVDSDDYFASKDSVRNMVDCLEATNADIAVGNYCRLWDGKILEATGHSTFSQMDPKSAKFRYRGFFSVGTLSYVWGKTYRHSFLKKHGITFHDYEYAEDKYFNFQCYIEQAQYVFLDDVVYAYRKNNASISHQYQRDRAECWLRISADLLHELDKRKRYAEYGDLVAFTVSFAAFFDGKAQYCKSGKKLKAVKMVLQKYGASTAAYQCFCQLSQGKFLDEACETGWKIVLWTFSALMRVKALYTLAFGIKLLIDFRIDERLSDTGLKKSK